MPESEGDVAGAEPRSWAWTVVAVAAFRHALCPALSLARLAEATAAGTIDIRERRVRRTQAATLRDLLKHWILG